ncbi:FadR/GntR family transcriptional regulator [Neorhizobium galegae]|uniref:FadR/GntR family transcriptional regulator n=1 Tax=Neorhizobium galegae TaxID=399 RepID=UPI000621A7A9|nr:GntR family transcriptional regulator [Neorhizobium galegae]CDZ25821.1 Transcriptional regulator [Neorhizobium galegae bv. officinalis]KAA9388520.1 FadR family transcriptional regulator [Neorhizobium galegae]KAB1114086.1 FadR family transcriptional regulator [Neorhizobium galegae]MCM2497027.1 GntR family transcriptional regulator [Neorhizobium galegae]MCQ1771095.1 GntR family transcriptional regulator [Neorhizobium galegae]
MILKYDEVVRTGIARQVSDNIRSAIMDGRLKIDERLPTEEELARSFGISRPTVREALKRLAAQNLIHSKRGPTGGNFVKRPDPEGLSKAITGAATLLVGIGAFDIEEIITARLETEAVCCRLSAANRCEADLAAMEAEIAVQLDETISDEDFCASDVRFHRALVDSTGNGPLKLMMYTVIEAFIPITNMIVFRVRERRHVASLHQEIVDAVRAREDAKAADALARLLAYVRESYSAVLDARAKRDVPSQASA